MFGLPLQSLAIAFRAWWLEVHRMLVYRLFAYGKILKCCFSLFVLPEQMYFDKIPLGDVTLPKGLETTLRTLLPPDAFD